MDRVITIIPQVDGSTRVVLAQDALHARAARRILRGDPAMIDSLDGIDGIRVSTHDER